MPPESDDNLRLEIGHVLFIDLVGYSKLLIEEQKERLGQLTGIVLATTQVREAPDEQLVRLATGDGMALVFRNSSEEPTRCALEVAQALKAHPEIALRMGIHSGPVSGMVDVSGKANVAGAGINLAQRVMDCGDAGHILLSLRVAEDLEQYERWRPFLHDIGTFEVKHGVRVRVINLYSDEVGNPNLPRKLQAVRKHRTHVRWAAAATALLVVAALAAGVLSFLRRGPAGSLAPAVDKSIAVLPFENLSEEKANAFFTAGVQDEILTHLARIADLKVISRTSVLQYKSDAPRNLREIGQQLGVAHVLEGSVQRAANKVRVNAQLINVRTDAHEWAENYDRPLDDVFAIQSEIAKAIAAQLKAKLAPDERNKLEQLPTSDIGAFDLYSRAKNLTLMAGTGGMVGKTLRAAIELLDQTVARDASFFAAYCLLVQAHGRLYLLGDDRTPARLAQMEAALDAATRLHPEAGETHLARAYYLYWGFLDYPGAFAELEKARTSLPNEPEIYALLGGILRRQGRWEEALGHIEHALELDPRNFSTVSHLSHTFEMMRRYDEAAAVLDRAVAVPPDLLDLQLRRADLDIVWKADTRALRRLLHELQQKNPGEYQERAFRAVSLPLMERDADAAEAALAACRDRAGEYAFFHALTGLVARMKGEEEKARAAFAAAVAEQEKTVRTEPDSGPALAELAQYEAMLGRKEAALSHGRRAMALLPVERDAVAGAEVLTTFASTAAWTAEKDLALEYLRRAKQLPGGAGYGYLKLFPDWDPLRGDPRFEKIVASLAPKEIP